jgi:hypothetical protein
MRRILFMSNWERTETWIAVGAELARRGIMPFFSITRPAHVDLAVAAGIPSRQILWLNRGAAKRFVADDALRARLAQLEARRGAAVRSFVLMDRFMRSEAQGWAEHYLLYVFAELERFIGGNGIALVAGQPDNIPDLLAEAIVKDRGGRYAAVFEFRLPSNRFMLWDGPLERRPHVTGPATPADVSPAELEAARTVRDRVLRRGRVRLPVEREQDRSWRRASLFRRLLRGFLHRALIVSRSDVYMYTLRSELLDLRYHRTPLNRWRLKLPWNRLFEQPRGGERFVFYALNYSPEHTLDVEAAPFTNAYETVRQIALGLPLGVKLYVKEHPVALGIRGPRALRRLKALPGVRLIDPAVHSHDLIERAELTVSLSGTAALEAALYGRPSAVISDIFIADFSTCRRLDAPWQVGAALAAPPPAQDEAGDLRFLAWLIANGHPGTVIEPLVDPTSLEPPNVSLVADAFEKLSAAGQDHPDDPALA